MNRTLKRGLITAALLIGGGIALKLTIPFSYAESELRAPAIRYVKELQKAGKIEPKQCAARYLYFETDYHAKTPDRIRIAEAHISEHNVRITLHDPSCQDDSIRSLISRIYLEKTSEDIWVPIRHEWSHTGRGRIGWTTKPTS